MFKRRSVESSNSNFGSFSWMKFGNDKANNANMNLENFSKIDSPADVVAVLKNSLEVKTDEYFHASLDLLTHLCQQDSSKNFSVELGNLGACSVVDQILGLKLVSPQSCECCLRALCSLVAEGHNVESADFVLTQNRKKLSSSGTIYRIVKAAHTHISNAIVLEWAMRVIHSLSLEEGVTSKLVVCGGCELFQQSISNHQQNNEILKWTCQNIFSFACDDSVPNIQDKFGENNLCELLVTNVLSNHTALTTASATWIMKAIGALARYHAVNKQRLASCGVCQLLAPVSKIVALDNMEFAESICWAIGNLAFPDVENQTLLGEHGCCAIVVNAITLHNKHSILVIQEGLRALRNLSYQHVENLQRLYELQICDIVMNVLSAYRENQNVLQWIWFAVSAIVELPLCLIAIQQNGLCSEVVSSLSRFGKYEDLVQWAAVAISKLAANTTLSNQIGKSQGCQALAQALMQHWHNADVTEEIFHAMGTLCSNNLDNRIVFSQQATIHEVIMKTIQKHEKTDTLVEAALYAMIHMILSESYSNRISSANSSPRKGAAGSIDSASAGGAGGDLVEEESGKFLSAEGNEEETSESLQNFRSLQSASLDEVELHFTIQATADILVNLLMVAGVARILPKILAKHAEDDNIALLGAKFLCALMNNNAGNKYSMNLFHISSKSLHAMHRQPNNRALNADSVVKLAAGGAAATLCTIIKQHMESIVNTQHAILALERLCSSEKNIAVVRAAGAVDLVVQALQQHATNSLTVVLCFQLIIHLAYDDLARERFGVIGGAEAILHALERYINNETLVKLGCDAVSSLCITPLNDATQSVITKDAATSTTITPSSGDNTSAKRKSVDWINFDGNTFDPNSLLGAATSTAAAKEPAVEPAVDSPKSPGEGGESFFGSWGKMSSAQKATGLEQLKDAAGMFISTGFSDQEAEVILAKQMAGATVKRSNNERFALNGVNRVIVSILQRHWEREGVLIACCNALNSLALHPTNRASFLPEGVLELLVAAYKKCLNDNDEATSPDPSLHETEQMRKLRRAAGDSSADSRRTLIILLNVVIGSMCLPLSSEIEAGKKASTSSGTPQPQDKIPYCNQEQLGALGACDVLAQCGTAFERDPLICEVFLRAFYFLLLSHEGNQKIAGRADGNRLVVRILRRHIDNPRVVYYACLCVSALAMNQKENSIVLGQEGVCPLVVNAMARYMAHEEVAEACCHAIYGLKVLNQLLGQEGACEFVLQTFTHHNNNATVSQWICRAIGSLAEYEKNKIDLDKHNVCKVVIQALQKHVSNDSLLTSVFMRDTSSSGVAQWGCTAIYYLAKGHGSEEYQQKLVNGGACEAVARALVKYSEVESVSYCCCRTLVVLLMNNEPYKIKLGALGVCACIVESLHLFPSSVQIAKWGCRVVAVLAEGNEANIAKLGMAGACETIPVVMQAHQNSEYVAGAGCDVISFMSEVISNGFASRLGHAGGCEAVVSVLRKHSNNPSVVSRACIALASLAREKGNASWFGPAGACEALLSALQHHQRDVNVAKFIISAIGNLCIIDFNKERLGTIGICEYVVIAMNIHIDDVETVKSAGLTIGKLCEPISRASNLLLAGGIKKNNESIVGTPLSVDGGAGGWENNEIVTAAAVAVSRARRNTITVGSADATPTINTEELTSKSAAATDATPAITVNETHVVEELLINTSRKNTIVDAVDASAIAAACVTLINNHHKIRRNRSALYAAGCCDVLVKALSQHLTDLSSAQILCRTISIISYGDACSIEREELGELGGCVPIVKAMQCHEGNEEMAKCGCLAVKSLAFHSEMNKATFHDAGVCALMVSILRGYRFATNGTQVIEAAAWAISNLAMDFPKTKITFGTSSACEGLLEILELHFRNAEITYLAVKALFHVCDGNYANRLKISFSGAADLLMNVLNRYSAEERILEYVYSVMICMAMDKVGQSKLGTVGACKAVVASLYRFEKSSEYIVLLCVALIGLLANHSTQNQSKLGTLGACKAVAGVMQKYLTATNQNALASNSSSSSGVPSSFNRDRSTTRTVSTGGSDSDLAGLETRGGGSGSAHGNERRSPTPDSASTASNLLQPSNLEEADLHSSLFFILDECSILKEGCKCIVYLCSNNYDANRQKFQATGVLDVLTSILSSTYVNSSTGNVRISEATRELAKNAMDSLIGATHA